MMKSFAFLVAVMCTSGYLWAQPTGVQKVTSIEGITEYRLNNGLRVLLFPDVSKQTITVNMTYLVGSRHEGYGETGMAHLLEHLVFKGTPKHPNIPQELTEHGARPNGTTWYDRTNYFETFNATEENLLWALDLESDRMVNSYIAKKDLESEFTVVRNEFERGENDPSGILMERVMSAAYIWHNYGKTTIGARSDIENVPIERLQAFYRKYYQPDNAVLTVSGKIDEEKTLKLINDYFGKIPRPDRKADPLFATYTREPVQDGERQVTLRRVGDVQVVSAMYHVAPGPHQDYPALALLADILSTDPSGILFKALVTTKKASSVFSFAPALKEASFLYIGTEVRKEDNLEDAKSTMLTVLDEIMKTPPTQEDVERARKKFLKNWELAYTNPERVGLGMSSYIAQGDWRLFFWIRDMVEKVTPAEVVQVANKYLKPSNRTVGLFIPEATPVRAEIPEAFNPEEILKGYKGRALVSQGESFDPSPSNIESKTQRGKLKNGIQFALLPKETRGDVVQAKMTLRFGDEKTLVGKSTAGELAAQMLMRGSKKYSRQQIKDELDKLNARVSIFGGSSSASINIETKRENLNAVIALVADVLKNPVFPQDEFEQLKNENLTGIENQLSEPTAKAFERYSKVMNPYAKNDVRYNMTMEEEIQDLKNIKLEEVKAFHKQFYGLSSAATVSVVGDFDVNSFKQTVEKEFTGWNSSVKYQRISYPLTTYKPVNESIQTDDKANGFFIAGMNMPVNDQHPDYAALMLGNYILGGGFLNSRLAVRIRQKEGISYNVGARFNASALDNTGTFTANAIYAPENIQRLEKAFQEELDKALNEGFTAEELEAAKNGWLQSQNVSRSQDPQLAGTLDQYLFLNRTMQYQADLESKIKALTPDQIKMAMKKHIDPSKLIIIKAGDFAKAQKTQP